MTEVEQPTWWNPRGKEMWPTPPYVKGEVLFQNGSGASVTIRAYSKRRFTYTVSYSLNHGEARTSGWFRVSEDTLRKMFGLAPDFGSDQTYAGDWFVRIGPYLNMPRRGSGKDHDPNLSLFISNDVLSAVEYRLL